MKNIFCILGKSASGKTTLANLVCQQLNISNVILTTTRPIRDDEMDGIDYYFTTVDEFEKGVKENHFVQYTQFRGWYYGIEKYSLSLHSSDDMVVVLNPTAFDMFSRNVSKKLYNIVPVYIQCDDRVRLQRSLSRDSDVDEVIRRYGADKKDFDGILEKVIEQNGFIIDNSSESLDYALNTLASTMKICSNNLQHGRN